MFPDSKIINEYIKFLYKFFLERKPDENGFNKYRDDFNHSGLSGFKNVLINLLDSEEYEKKIKEKNKNEIDEKIIHEFLTYIYNYFLKRDPDEAGFNAYNEYFKVHKENGFKHVLENVLESEEYKSRPFDLNLEINKEFDFDQLDNSVITSLYEKTANFWRNYASEPSNIYWSVLAEIKNKKRLNTDERKLFLNRGKKDIIRIRKICDFIDYDFNNCKNFLDFGCGVGRIVVNLPSTIEKVNCVDFSLSHLKETEENLKKYSAVNNFSMFFIENFFDLEKLPKNQDIIYSYIVLQHNTPPVIEKTVEILLNLLSKGGIAILHIPLTIPGYKFNPYEYLENNNSGKTMELHILPKSNIFKLAKNNKSNILYSLCEGGINREVYSEIIVFKKN